MATKKAFYSDSYVKRLQDFCNCDLQVPRSVYWFDKGGLLADFKKRDGKRKDAEAKAMYTWMFKQHPDVAFINMSSNDIMTQTTSRDLIPGCNSCQ